MNDQQLRAWLDKHFTDEQLKKLGLSLAETIAEGRLEADLEEALGGTAPVDLWPDIGDATTWAAAVRDVQDERRRQRMLLEDAANPFTVIPENGD